MEQDGSDTAFIDRVGRREGIVGSGSTGGRGYVVTLGGPNFAGADELRTDNLEEAKAYAKIIGKLSGGVVRLWAFSKSDRRLLLMRLDCRKGAGLVVWQFDCTDGWEQKEDHEEWWNK